MKSKERLVMILTFAFTLPVGITMMSMSAPKPKQKLSSTPARVKGPCDIYATGGTPCVAAHSSTRALYAAYNGPLYQVMRESDGRKLDIGLVKGTEYANAAAQDAFCTNTLCYITKIYDQSGKGNHLEQAPPGTFKGPAKGEFNTLPIADMAPITINGHKAYGVYIMPGMGLRNNNAKDLAINDEPEGIYYVINGKHFDSGCCFDYGNSSTNSRAVGTGTMETTYYGTSTAWGSGNGPGPWIMADMEAGLFSGFNVKKNDVPSIESWRFVTAIVDGGSNNKWDLRGGNAQQGGLTTFYSGVRPRTPESNAYSPMNKKGGILVGNGGDNGNGSSGTFYEGVMTTGYPTIATTDALQANIVAAKYDVQRVSLTRATTFTPKSVQSITVTYTNTTGTAAKGVKLSIQAPKGWTAVVPGTTNTSRTFGTIAPNASVSSTFNITSPIMADAGYITGKAEWTNSTPVAMHAETVTQRVRSASPVKINEVRLSSWGDLTNQFIELYNASENEVNISNWSIINTPSGWSSVKLGTIPTGTKIPAHGFYVLGLSPSGLVAPAVLGQNVINLQSIKGFEVGQQISIDGESGTIANIGTPATAMSTLFIPVSTGPWLNFPVGSTNLPVTSSAGFTVGQKIGIDMGGKYEVATVTAVGKAATQTNLAVAAKAGDATIKVVDNSNMTVGDVLIINTGARKETVKVKRIINVVAASPRGRATEAGEVELSTPLKLNHMLDVDVAGTGTGISFSPATRFTHKSGDAVQALGTGITLKNNLIKSHATGAAVVSAQNTIIGYQALQKPDQWYGLPLSTTAGSIALMDASGTVLVDGMVYGAQQSNSSANGTIASPEIATLEGDQGQGGCIVIVPGSAARANATTDQGNRSVGRFPDGNDSDSNCRDFQYQNAVALTTASTAGSNNIKVASVAGFSAGQKITIGSGNTAETAVISTIGTAGGAKVGTATEISATTIPITGIAGFEVGQTVTIGDGANRETAVIASITPGRRGGPATTSSITVNTPLKYAHAVDAQVSGTGITLSAPLSKAYNIGTQIASGTPTPGASNQYLKR